MSERDLEETKLNSRAAVSQEVQGRSFESAVVNLYFREKDVIDVLKFLKKRTQNSK